MDYLLRYLPACLSSGPQAEVLSLHCPRTSFGLLTELTAMMTAHSTMRHTTKSSLCHSPRPYNNSLRSSSNSSSTRGPRRIRRRAAQLDQETPYSVDSVTSSVYEEEQYESTQQSEQRKSWRASVRSATGRKHHVIWEPTLDPPALLSSVCVVLVGPKKPISCGVVARACSCFECEDIRFVQPRCDHVSRSSRSVSKGAQYILHRGQLHDTLPAVLADCDLSVAFTRWLPELQHKSLPDLPSLLAQPLVQQMLQQSQLLAHSSSSSGPADGAELGTIHVQLEGRQQQLQQATCDSNGQLQQAQRIAEQHQRPVRIALVFGREEYGLSDEEVAACDLACAISIGRLQESLSLSHAVSIVLAQLYQARLSALAAETTVETNTLPYTVRSVEDLAQGYDTNSGTEH